MQLRENRPQYRLQLIGSQDATFLEKGYFSRIRSRRTSVDGFQVEIHLPEVQNPLRPRRSRAEAHLLMSLITFLANESLVSPSPNRVPHVFRNF